ncbi:uncharacterized protein LOC143359015 [Halictus rubicundus]|uniref:uncharacterized protein LOC143359015 n=1 Tax=Halictus rubicundus TaxID=77578 RepID=UPI0040350304
MPLASSTPFRTSKNNSKSPAGKLLHRTILQTPEAKYSNPKGDKWDKLDCPQFVDFTDLPQIGDSFFDKQKVIVSTPKADVECAGSSAHSFNDNTIIESLKTISLSGIDFVSPNKESIEQSTVNDTVIRVETNEQEECKAVKTPLSTAINPFRFHGRDKCKQGDNEPKRVKKNLEEEKKPRVFRANPLPKYLKVRAMEANKNNKNDNNNAAKIDSDAIVKGQKLQSPNKKKKNTEIGKKPPSVPCLVQTKLSCPKIPTLRLEARVQERKRYNAGLKLKEMKVQEQKQLELEAKQEQEKAEIALLRKTMVHKAQPIRKYKSGLPKIQKRQLTSPQTPLTLKRRRTDNNSV